MLESSLRQGSFTVAPMLLERCAATEIELRSFFPRKRVSPTQGAYAAQLQLCKRTFTESRGPQRFVSLNVQARLNAIERTYAGLIDCRMTCLMHLTSVINCKL
jgi:hypothetical protein